MSTNKDDVLRQFCDVTGADESRSKFFLESANWQLEVALSSFYEHGYLEEAPSFPPGGASAQAVPTIDSDGESPPGSPVRPKKDKKKKTDTKFATMNSLQADSSSDEEEGEAFYAGGSERSGQQILGPPGKGRKDIVTEIFKSVRERGAVVFDDEPSSTRGRQGAVFGGTGYRLGQTSDDHEQVAPPNAQEEGQGRSRSVRLRLYREGFTVDDGELRPYSNPENAQFLSCIRMGEIPPELATPGGEVRVSLEDHRHEDCARRAHKPQAFTGKGHMLGSPTPPTIGATASVTGDVSDRAANQRAAQESLRVDDARPVTTVQFRLADGSRLTGRFNHSHTVADLHQYVANAEPAYQLQPFILLTTFPSSELTDLTATLADAKLLNTTVLQRLK